MSELPLDPDLEDLPDKLAQHRGPMKKIVGEDQHGNVWEAPITYEELAAAFANWRRMEDELQA